MGLVHTDSDSTPRPLGIIRVGGVLGGGVGLATGLVLALFPFAAIGGTDDPDYDISAGGAFAVLLNDGTLSLRSRIDGGTVIRTDRVTIASHPTSGPSPATAPAH